MVWLGEIAADLYPQRAGFRVALGDAYREEERWQAAIQEYGEALVLDSGQASAYVGLGLTWQALGQFQESLVAFQQAAALKPNSEQIYRLLGDTYRATDQPKEAIVAYERALTLNETLADKGWFCMRLGRAYYEAEQWDLAAKMFERVLQLEPDSVPAQQYLRRIRP
jgi:tetratricopeptide (TPR) repeat protein